jgi:hypothetical protein
MVICQKESELAMSSCAWWQAHAIVW